MRGRQSEDAGGGGMSRLLVQGHVQSEISHSVGVQSSVTYLFWSHAKSHGGCSPISDRTDAVRCRAWPIRNRASCGVSASGPRSVRQRRPYPIALALETCMADVNLSAPSRGDVREDGSLNPHVTRR